MMGMLDDITNAMDAVTSKLMPKAKPVKQQSPKELPRVKSPHEYEQEDAERAEMKANALQRTPKPSGQKLVPDHILNYGE